MSRKLIPLALLLLGGCAANSGVVPIGLDTYLVSHQGSGFWVMPTQLRNDALIEANQYCKQNNKIFQVNKIEMLEQIPATAPGGPRFPVAEVQFMCLDSNDPDLVRKKQLNTPNTVIEIRQK